MLGDLYKFKVVLKSTDNHRFEFKTLAENEAEAEKEALKHIAKEMYDRHGYEIQYTEKLS